jgi:signal peptidase I
MPARTLRRGDVVVFRFPKDPSRDFIKRCVGLPGDTVAMRDKALVLNGEVLEEGPFIYHKDARTFRSPVLDERLRRRDNFGPVEVPPDHYFFLGDNRDDSHDSRFWGPVPRDHVKGRAVVVYWSLAPEAAVAGAGPAPGGAARLLARLGRVRDGTRWERIFRVVR